jgi:hypothetical protein
MDVYVEGCSIAFAMFLPSLLSYSMSFGALDPSITTGINNLRLRISNTINKIVTRLKVNQYKTNTLILI